MKDKTEIIKVKGDWVEVVNDARATVGKEGLGKEPSEKFKRLSSLQSIALYATSL